ncbi:MAG: hypothetical protein CMA77_05435 [Euryarchaeota archaeon]|nr:hypothetical protein [Euryarchaeota archaeon]
MATYWFEGIILVFLVGIYARLWFISRHLDEIHDCLHHFEERAFRQDDEVQVEMPNGNLRVMGLEEFMDEFGFDPRQEEPPTTEEIETNVSEIEAWDNDTNTKL